MLTRQSLIGTSIVQPYLLSSILRTSWVVLPEKNLIKLVFYLPREWSHWDNNRATRKFFVHIDSVSGRKKKKGWKKKRLRQGILSRHRIFFFNNKESVVSLSRLKYASLFSFVGRVSNLWTNHNWKRTFIQQTCVYM